MTVNGLVTTVDPVDEATTPNACPPTVTGSFATSADPATSADASCVAICVAIFPDALTAPTAAATSDAVIGGRGVRAGVRTRAGSDGVDEAGFKRAGIARGDSGGISSYIKPPPNRSSPPHPTTVVRPRGTGR